jgi:hypothetical protein
MTQEERDAAKAKALAQAKMYNAYDPYAGTYSEGGGLTSYTYPTSSSYDPSTSSSGSSGGGDSSGGGSNPWVMPSDMVGW